MKATVSFRFLVSSAIFFLFVIFASGQEERPGIECGCTKTGKYVEPGLKKILVDGGTASNEGSSSKGKYKLYAVDASDVAPDAVNITINCNSKTIFNETISATGWGFSPDEDRFVMFGQFGTTFWVRLVDLNPDGDKEGEQATIVTNENLISSAGLSSANISFSPHGKYLLFAAIDNSSPDGPKLLLKVYYVKTGDIAYDASGTNMLGYASGKSVAGWGFSPDIKDATFVHAYLTSSTTYSLRAVKLTATSFSEMVASDNQPGDARFLFSPCGDYFAWIYGTETEHDGMLFNTNSGDLISEFDAEIFKYLSSRADEHYIVYNNTDSTWLVDNLADQDCRDATAPTWSDDALLDTGLVEGVNMELHWSGATDRPNPVVAAYRIYKDNELYKEIEADSIATVTGLKPEHEYFFRIEAGDEAGNWSTNGPDGTFTTFYDSIPFWPDPNITTTIPTETRVTLKWKDAHDDYGIESYKIYMDNNEIARVGSNVLEYKIKNLKAATNHKFLIRAVDAAGQDSACTEKPVTMASLKAPDWPTNPKLSDSANTETSLIIKWPAAIDNCDAIRGYKISMNENPIGQTEYYNREYLVKGLTEDTEYSFEVTAFDESQTSGPGLKGTFSTLPSFIVTPLIKTGSNQKRPDIDGKMVVWWDDTLDAGDIYSYDLETDSLRRVTTDPHAQFDPAVSGDRIVWTDTRNGNLDIYMYDSIHGEKPVCIAPGDQDLPAIDGDRIVWRDNRAGNNDIYCEDLTTSTYSQITTRNSNQNWPDISGDYIVYADDRNGNWDIFMYTIYNGKETAICTNPADQTYPVITGKHLENLAIAYADERNTKKDIYIYYPSLFQGYDYEYLVPLDISPFNTPQTFPHLDDYQMVYQDPLGGPGTDSNIWAFKFAIEGFAGGTKKKIFVDKDYPYDQIRPRTSQGNIVWQDERNGNSDIYMCTRPPFSDLQISVKVISDPIEVGDTLEYIISVKNNGPKMNTSIRTYCTLPIVAKFDTLKVDRGTADLFGNTVKWNIDTLRNGASAKLEIFMATYDLAVLEFEATTEGNAFDSDGSNNEITATTKVKNFMPAFVGIGSEPSIQTGQDGRDHLVYFGTDSSLVYSTRLRKGKWEYKSLGKYFATIENDMVVNNTGNLQVITSHYFDSGNENMAKGRLVQITLDKEGKINKRIIAVSDSGFYSLSLKNDSKDELHLVYQNAPCQGACKGVIKEMRTNGGQWLQPEVISSIYADVDMAIDKEDNLHAGYYTYDEPLYQRKNSAGNGTWEEPEEVEPDWDGYIMEGMTINIATDDALNPHIAYYGSAIRNPDNYLMHAWKSNDVWQYEPIEGRYSSPGPLVIDPDGKTNASYLSTPAGKPGRSVWYATNITGPYIKQEVSEIKGKGFKVHFDMGRDMDKYTHIAYNGGYDSVLFALIPPVEYFKINPEKLDFGPAAPGTEKKLDLELTNPMSENIRIDSITVPDGRITFDKTSFILYRHSSAVVNVTFKQTDAPWTNTRLTIWYNSPSGLHITVPVKAKGWQPELTVDQDPIDFGAVPLNTLVTKTVKLTNTGVTDLIISVISISSSTDFKLVGPTSATLLPEQTCDVQISFKPSTNTNKYSYLNITSDDPVASNRKIEITGKTANPKLYCQSNEVNFGFCPAGQSLSETVTIKNTGELVLNITGVTLSGPDMDQFSSSNSCTSVEPGGSCNIQVTMTPTKTADFTAYLDITSNSSPSGTYSITLKGFSQARTLELSPALIDFGSVPIGEESRQILELRNKGSVDAYVYEARIEGINSYEFRRDTYLSFIPAGSTVECIVIFNPQFEGDKTSDLVITTNDSGKPVQRVTLKGKGSQPPLQVSIGADPQSGSEPLTVKFTASVTGGQPPYNYLWNFDNMKTTDSESPEYKFTGLGVYNVSLKVTDFWENSVRSTIKISVSAEGVPVVIANAQPDIG